MYGGGYYPLMDSVEWKNAPWNEPDEVYETCPECNGDGVTYFDDDGKEYSVAEYERLSEAERKEMVYEICARCGGDGEILVEEDDDDYWDED